MCISEQFFISEDLHVSSIGFSATEKQMSWRLHEKCVLYEALLPKASELADVLARQVRRALEVV